MSRQRVSSPAATGGAGTAFEQHVGAYWLAQLLVGGIPPILLEGAVAGVAFQTEHLGWRTDDFLITCEAGDITVGRVAAQAKRTFAVSASDDECKKSFADFWADFNAPRFSKDADRLALVVQRGTEMLLRHFGGLLDGARAARDGADFERRLATPGLMDQRSIQYCDEIRAIIREIENRDVSAAEIWPFLRGLHVLPLDLATATAQHEAMIKTLLAHTAGAGGTSAATVTWNELVVLASTAIPAAKQFRRSELPEPMRLRHAAKTGDDLWALDALRRHSGPVMGFIRSVIGSGLHLSRAALVQKTLEQLEQHQVVLISGPAGCGKSAIAKDAIVALSADSFTFAFRAEEFAQPHIDATLEAAKVPVHGETLLKAILAAHGRKVVLVESVERLLEKSTRDAFDDLLRLVVADKALRVVLTCREYSTTLVRDAFLDRAELRHAVVTVPELDDTELSAVQDANPEMARPLAHPVLRPLLRNPYILDKASRISWPDNQSLPETEHEFRALFWRQIVRADQDVAGGMPQRREDTLVQIALRRARSLSMHVDSDGLDREVIDRLRHDGLVESPGDVPTRVAPAHDVLEDWAILRWLHLRHAAGDETFGRLSADVGGHPAVRRSYRKWVAELIEGEPAAAERLFRAAIADETVSAQFRDDTLVSLLRAPSAPAILARLKPDLLRDDQKLLRRVIHLLRVACVAPIPGLPTGAQSGSILNVPDGTAWAAVLELVRANFASLVNPDYALLVGLIDDWSRGVSWQQPYPSGAEPATAIAHWLLPHFSPYRHDDVGHKILKVIAKIPKADATKFGELLHENENRSRGDHTAREFRELIFGGLDGNFAARDLADVVIQEALEYLLCRDSDLRDSRGGYSIELELHFGLKENIELNSFPPSASRGPWFALLCAHASKALEFFAKVFDHSADWYVHPRVPDPLEEAFEIQLTFSDGTTRKQWANWRLWCLYRGTSVGPYTLQSMLMALEQWLLQVAEAHPKLIDNVLLNILRRNQNIAMTGAVASVASAFPLSCGETLLVLLSARNCIALDRARMVSEASSPSQIDLGLPAPAEHTVYRQERKKADQRPHRKHDLEWAIANLQFGPLAARVHEIIDRHRGAMPLVAEQTDDDRVWRLALDRMDMRRYRVSDEEVVVRDPADGKSRTYLRLVMAEPDPDIKQMVDESAGLFAASSARLGLLTWALAMFRHEQGNYDPGAWREKLTQARTDADTPVDLRAPLSVQGAPGIIAATCIRDHWDEMSDDERTWCLERACAAVLEGAENWDEMQRMQRFEMMPDRSCAWVMAGLLGKKLTAAQRKSIERAFIASLTHPTEEVQWYATWGVAEQLWSIDPALALRCVNAAAFEATILWEARRADEKRPYLERQYKDAGPKAATEVRSEFWKDRIPSDAYEKLDVSDWPGTRADARALTILAKAPDQPATVTGFTRLAKVLVEWWDADDDRGRGHGRQRDYHAEAALRQRLERFLLSTSETTASSIVAPILDVVDRHPRQVHEIIQGLTSAEDGQVNTPQYWFLWKLFADRIRQAKWVKHLPGGHSIGDQAVASIFLQNYWKEDARHWKSLEGYAQLLDELFDDLPPSGAVLNDYVRFLYTIGSQSLPGAFCRIERSLRAGASRQMLTEENDTIFMLEVILQRNVYVRPLELKSNPALRHAILSILDILVDNGSSAAFRMRDDFVTPVARSQQSTEGRD